MKIFITIARLIVGSLFIVSGLIKCNDTIGFSYKLNDYFAQDVLNLEFLIPYSIGLAVIICVVEIALGVALIFGFKSKLTTTLVLIMMLFFTWLTWYTSSCLVAQEAASVLGEEFTKNCVTDCGCFGDALKLKPKESFYKDLFLLVFTIPLFFASFKKMIPINKPKEDIFYIVVSMLLILGFGVFVIGWWFTVFFSLIVFLLVYFIKNKFKSEWLSLLVVYVISLAFAWYCLQYLPIKDFRAYKVGANIPEGMVVPENAQKAVQEFTWTFNVGGEKLEFVTDGSYPTVDGENTGVTVKIIEEGYVPPIKDFSIESDDEDLTAKFLAEEHLIMVVSYNLEKANEQGFENIKNITDKAIKNGYTVIGLTASGTEDKQLTKDKYDLNFDFYLCDEKALKTVIRSNPGILKLEKGTVIQKEHFNDAEDIELTALPNAIPNLDFDLKRKLDSIMTLDQKFRKEGNLYQENWKLQNVIDSTNLILVENIIKKHGYPGKSLVGEPANKTAWYVIQHSDKISEYLPIMKAAGKKQELPFNLVAKMEDRYLMDKEEEQIYGTQGFLIGNPKDGTKFIWPIKDVENVNKRRKEAGFDSTVEQNAKHLFGDDFEFKHYSLEEVKKLKSN